MATAPNGKKGVIVTTSHKGVFFGLVPEDQDLPADETIELENAIMVIYWPASQRGVLGLASTPGLDDCRLSAPVPRIKINHVDSVIECTEEKTTTWLAHS